MQRKKNEDKTKSRIGIGYGEYYADVIPEDAEELKNMPTNNGLYIKTGLLVFALVLIVATCIVIMSLV